MGMDPITIGAGAMLGGAVLGGIGGSQKQGASTTSTSSSSAPWQPQQQYLTSGFANARTALDNALANPVYQGQRVADLNPFSTTAANSLANFSQNNFGLANSATNAANSMLTPGSQYGANAANLYSQLNGADPTQQILNTAGQYANSPYANGMIDAAGRDISRGLNEQTLPSLNRQFSGTGNTNSTRAGVESAIAQRGAADRYADMSNNIRGSLFNTGLSQGQNQYNQNLQNTMAANNQLYNAYNVGQSGLGNAATLANTYYNQGNTAGSLYQTQDQNQLNANMAAFNEANQNPLNFIGSYMNAVNGNYGGTSSGTSSNSGTGGGWQGALSGALGGGVGMLGTAAYANKAGLFG